MRIATRDPITAGYDEQQQEVSIHPACRKVVHSVNTRCGPCGNHEPHIRPVICFRNLSWAARPRIWSLRRDVLERFYLPLLSISFTKRARVAHGKPVTHREAVAYRIPVTHGKSIAEREAVAEQDQVAKEYRSAAHRRSVALHQVTSQTETALGHNGGIQNSGLLTLQPLRHRAK